VDQRQVCQALGLPKDKVRLTLAGWAARSAAGGPVHARARCLLGWHTGKPVKMSYNREESYSATCPAPGLDALRVRRRTDGTLVYAKADILFDGGAYASSTGAVVGNGGTMGLGPYRSQS